MILICCSDETVELFHHVKVHLLVSEVELRLLFCLEYHGIVQFMIVSRCWLDLAKLAALTLQSHFYFLNFDLIINFLRGGALWVSSVSPYNTLHTHLPLATILFIFILINIFVTMITNIHFILIFFIILGFLILLNHIIIL